MKPLPLCLVSSTPFQTLILVRENGMIAKCHVLSRCPRVPVAILNLDSSFASMAFPSCLYPKFPSSLSFILAAKLPPISLSLLIIHLTLVNTETYFLLLFEYLLTVLKCCIFQPPNNLLDPNLPLDTPHSMPLIRIATHSPQYIQNSNPDLRTYAGLHELPSINSMAVMIYCLVANHSKLNGLKQW